MQQQRPSLHRALTHGWLAGLLLFLVVVSPPMSAASEKSLAIHHLAHWLMVAAGAQSGYLLRDRIRLVGRALIAAAALVATLTWHLPPLLDWAEGMPATHAFAHLTLLAGGAALGWAVPAMSGAARAYLFIGVNVIMWPLVLAELVGAFPYKGYAGQTAAAGLIELAAMSAAWVAIFGWSRLRALFRSPVGALTAQALLAGLAIAGWASRLVMGG